MMRKILMFFGVLFILAVIAAAAAAVYAQRVIAESAPEVTFVSKPAMKVVYVPYQGDYIDTAKHISQFTKLSVGTELKCSGNIVAYYNNSYFTGDDSYYSAGCIVDEFPETLPSGMKQREIPAGDYAQITRVVESNENLLLRAFLAARAIEQHGAIYIPPVLRIYERGLTDTDVTVLMPIRYVKDIQ
ncbi:MAG: GyrI-like domain-containing protein [Bdellovibrionales bacterium]